MVPVVLWRRHFPADGLVVAPASSRALLGALLLLGLEAALVIALLPEAYQHPGRREKPKGITYKFLTRIDCSADVSLGTAWRPASTMASKRRR